MKPRNTSDIILALKELVSSRGYIYALCLIIMDDFHMSLEQMHQTDHSERLSRNEVSFILGLLIQNPISLENPISPFVLQELKKKTYSLMEELHMSTLQPMIDKFMPLIKNPNPELLPDKIDFLGGEDAFIEPIFYSGDGLYDFQYLEFLERKYKYDKTWLSEKKHFEFIEVIEITSKLKNIHQDRLKKVNFIGLRENKSTLKKEFKKNKSILKKDRASAFEEYISVIEFSQYQELFETEKHVQDKTLTYEEIRDRGWTSFYDGLLNLLCISPSDFEQHLDIANYLNNFSISANTIGINKNFKQIGDFNLFTAKPIIQLSTNRYFIPITFSVFEAVYESPYYWMLEDKKYSDQLAQNRGKVGEEITFEILVKVFGKNKVFHSVRVESQKGHDATDIDILCILGNKALCVQVKSKKLTQLSRQGNFEQLQKDFKGAVQDAYNQGIICREKILNKSATFYSSNGDRLTFAEDIMEVYILGITTENYPSLLHQTSTLLVKKDDDPFPLFMTIFDLELVAFYIDNPYDFLYYIRQRVNLADYFNATEEIDFLGYHLINKLWKDPTSDYAHIDRTLGELVNRNYYPFKLGIDIDSREDKIQNRWTNEDFKTLCSQLEDFKTPKVTDVIFKLLDWSNQSRDQLVKQIKETKRQTEVDNSSHNFSLFAGPNRSTFGLTYISSNSNNYEDLKENLLSHSRVRKYKCKADNWIGIGSLRNSGRLADCLFFNDDEWKYDALMEEMTNEWFGDEGSKREPFSFRNKIGRNEPCPCSSGKKYKHCCGRKR